MLRKLADFERFIANYRFYRDKGYNFKASWNLAGMTLP